MNNKVIIIDNEGDKPTINTIVGRPGSQWGGLQYLSNYCVPSHMYVALLTYIGGSLLGAPPRKLKPKV